VVALAESARVSRRVTTRAQDCLLRRVRWTPPQLAFLLCMASEKLLRCGNQFVGKTLVGLAWVIYQCLQHPEYAQVKRTKGRAWIVCASWQQSIEIQRKLWELLPKEALDPRTTFDDVNGFSPTKSPVVRFKNGWTIRIKTTNQGALNIAGATIDVVLVDELTTPDVYRELQRRVMRRAGVIALTLTPINAPAEWLQELVARGQVTDLHFRFEPANTIPVGGRDHLRLGDGTPMDAAWMAEQRAKYAPEVAAVILDGEWQTDHAGRELGGYSDRLLFGDNEPLPQFESLALGMDHGEGVGRECAYLVGWDAGQSTLWVLGEYCNTTTANETADAEGIDRMLRGWRLRLDDIDRARGDINSAGYSGGGLSVNEVLQREFARLNGGRLPFVIEGADKTAGTVKKRAWRLNSAMLQNRVRIHRSCERLIRACRAWQGGESEKEMWHGHRVNLKDPIDALGYIAMDYLEAGTQPHRLSVVGGDGRGIRRS
jgi:hypothetical protein